MGLPVLLLALCSCWIYGRTDPILDDVGDAFKLMGVNLHELEDYIHNIEPVTFAHQIPSFPVSKNNVLQFPQPGSKDAEERKEYIPDYLPPIVSSQEVLPFPFFAADVMLGPVSYQNLMLSATWKRGNPAVKLHIVGTHL
ncbi:transcription initiation factor TFIID subunit 3 [Pitangus sulphuratus]|nr:transcription initiation factor TFIID subunit 3 [Pitangus sulphuratus]